MLQRLSNQLGATLVGVVILLTGRGKAAADRHSLGWRS